MKRLPQVAILLVAVALVAAENPEKKKKDDAEKIQGKWIAVEVHFRGKKHNPDKKHTITFTLSGKKLTLKGTDGEQSAVELRPDKKPKEMDTTSSTGKVERSLYELSGDALKICTEFNNVRPKKTGTAADDNRVMLVFKRAKGDDKK